LGEKWSTARRMMLAGGATALAMWLLLYAPSPYVVYEPGIAVPVESMVVLESANSDEEAPGEGDFVLTAVRLTAPNIWGVIKAGVDRNMDVRWKRQVFGGKTKNEYVERLNDIMSGSQNTALQAAYNYSKIKYRVENGSVIPEQTADAITIKANEIGGPSAGLVFALQAIELLEQDDLSRGLKIAATGTIDAVGNVGAIGGVKQKTVSVTGYGADLFIVPKGNEKEARRTAKRLNGDTVIVGVSSLAEAVQAISAFALERTG
jgi:PDZ domain-containing protein